MPGYKFSFSNDRIDDDRCEDEAYSAVGDEASLYVNEQAVSGRDEAVDDVDRSRVNAGDRPVVVVDVVIVAVVVV